jgi:3-methyladenine DNA glycosylase AlkD
MTVNRAKAKPKTKPKSAARPRSALASKQPAGKTETAESVLAELKSLGQESIKRVLKNHGAPEPIYGVKVEDLKKIQKRVKKNHELALALYDTGVSDAMYLAGLIAEPDRMTRADLARWLKGASWSMIGEYAVAGTAAESPYGFELARQWIDSDEERVASIGWATLAAVASVRDDAELDLAEWKSLLKRVEKTIHQQPNRVRYTMNGFVIAAGCYVAALTGEARRVAQRIGKVHVDMGATSCHVPLATDYIAKVEARGAIGKKRKTAMC